jgi:hypothetical protein
MKFTKKRSKSSDEIQSPEIRRHVKRLEKQAKEKRRSKKAGLEKQWQADIQAQKQRQRWEFNKVKAKHIYMITCGFHFKIGISDCPEKRLHSIQTGNPMKCSLHAVWKPCHAPSLEKMIHDQFAKFRVRGEWFRGEAMNAVIAKISGVVGTQPVLETE